MNSSDGAPGLEHCCAFMTRCHCRRMSTGRKQTKCTTFYVSLCLRVEYILRQEQVLVRNMHISTYSFEIIIH